MLRIIFLLLFSQNLLAMITSDLVLIQIATNTLNSLRDLNQILTEQREFSENFERIYSKVDQAIWKADRVGMWLEDMKSLSHEEIKDLDSFNSVLASLKNETRFLRSKLMQKHRENKETERQINISKKEVKKSKRRSKKYSNELKGAMSPNQAQIETAKNTHDMLLEISLLNNKMAKLSIEVGRLTSLEQKKEKRRLAQLNSKKGILTQKDVTR